MIPEFDMSDDKIHYGEKTAEEIKRAGLPLYIWGCDITAITLKQKLELYGIHAADFVTDRVDVKIDGVLSRDEFLAQNPTLEYSIIRGFRESFLMSDDEIRAAWRGCRHVYTMADCYEGIATEEISRDFYVAHKADFDEVYDNLADEHSKKSLAAFIQAKVLKTHTPILSVTLGPQYFFTPSPWRYSNDDVLIDCGAYDGDSIADFIALRGKNYGAIIACEPDPCNFEKLKSNLRARNVERALPLNVGIGGEKSALKFSSSNSQSSVFSDDGDITVDIETIDNISGNTGGGEKSLSSRWTSKVLKSLHCAEARGRSQLTARF